MMEISSGLIKLTKDSPEEKKFNELYASIIGMSEEFLTQYHNEIIKLGCFRTFNQDLMLTVIAYARGQVRKEYFEN